MNDDMNDEMKDEIHENEVNTKNSTLIYTTGVHTN